jgi:pSer/pThr/pTyr-binding forkhead associated (FHA) protein
MSRDTIIGDSPTGKRLENLKRDETLMIAFFGQTLPLVGKIVIGRDRSCDIVLENSMVSKRHALIQKIKDDYFITDLGSTNGTFINKDPVPEGKYIKTEPGDRIKIGKTVLRIK